jgi:opacity protein-like surface antigen
MNNYFFIISLVLGGIYNIHAQSGLTFESHYPIITTTQSSYEVDNGKRNNSGVIGGNFQYQFTDNLITNYGIEYKFDIYQDVIINQYTNGGKKNFVLMSNINLFGKFLFIDMPELQLIASGGFTVYKKGGNGSRSHTGYNFGGGVQYDIFDGVYVFTNYNYAKAKLKQNNEYSTEPEYHHIIRLGLGFRL